MTWLDHEPGQGRHSRELEVDGSIRRSLCCGGDLVSLWRRRREVGTGPPDSLPGLPAKAPVEGTFRSLLVPLS